MIFVYFSFMLFFNIALVLGSDQETDLITKLLTNYNPYARPVRGASSQVNLEMILTLKQIVNLDVRKQILKTKLWLEYYWKDKNLVWKPVSYFSSSYIIYIAVIMIYNILTAIYTAI